MINFHITRPNKTKRLYHFIVRNGETALNFGFEAVNFDIRHHEIWDSVYPLMFVTRNGGPIFNKLRESEEIVVSFDYRLLRSVVDYFINRAASFGYRLTVASERYDAFFSIQAGADDAIAFGGGKDSRLALGMLVELGIDPMIFVAGEGYAPDIPHACKVRPISGRMPDRLIPGLMQFPARYYIGSGLGEVHLERPWHQYYDISHPNALHEFSRLFRSLGAEIAFVPAVCVLPYNLTQKILYERYPALYRHQISTPKGELSEKNLHVSLLKAYHKIDFSSHLNLEGFRLLAKQFVQSQESCRLVGKGPYGFRNHRAICNREMRAILLFLSNNDAFLRSITPGIWKTEPWIDYVHPYVFPEIPDRMLSILKQHAPVMDALESPIRKMFAVA